MVRVAHMDNLFLIIRKNLIINLSTPPKIMDKNEHPLLSNLIHAESISYTRNGIYRIWYISNGMFSSAMSKNKRFKP